MKTPLAKRLVLVLMVFTFVITAVACSGGSDPTSPKPDTTPSSQPSSPVTSDPGSSDSDNVVLPDIDYDYEFLICGIEDANYPSAALFADELNDEAINDAVYERNAKIEEVLGVTISGDLVKNVYKTANENISSGFNTYDMYMVPLDKAMTLAKDDYLVDLNELEWLDLDKPWWDQNCNESLALGDKLYTTTGDIDILDEELCFVIIFNKTKASEFHIDPYALVESGDWTIDKLLEFQTIMNIDLVDDTVKDYNDQWALLSAANTSTIFYWAAGERLIVRDENGMPTLGVNSTRAQNVISKVLDFMVDSEVITSNQISNWAGSDAWQIQLDMIMDGRAVFRSTVLKVARDMRDMENMIFGILPNPKYEKSQEKYYTPTSSAGYVPGVCVPVTNEDLSRTGAVLEAMAYYGREYITPAYKETTLEGIVVKDEESLPMLDIIFSTKVYDMGYIYNFGDMQFILQDLVIEGSKDFASALDEIINDITSDINDIVDKFSV